MPADRLLHARLGHSAKVSGLSDLEFRVWTTYILAADDFGVMRADAVAFQAAHDGLSKRQAKAIQRAIERLVKVGLVAAFTHQGSRYLFQIDWQDFQRVRYPLRTMHPLPAAAEVSPKTRHLWSVHPGGAKVPALTKSSGPIAVRLPETSGATAPEAPGAQSGPGASPGGFPKSPRKAPERDPEDSGTCAGTLPSHARACQTANGLRPMAIKRVGVRGRENRRPGVAARAAAFVERYRSALYPRHRGVAYAPTRSVEEADADAAERLCSAWDDAVLEQLVERFLTAEGDRFLEGRTRTLSMLLSVAGAGAGRAAPGPASRPVCRSGALDGAPRGVRRGDRAGEVMTTECERCERTPGWEPVVVDGVSRLRRCVCWTAAHAASPSVPREFRDARWATWRRTAANQVALEAARQFLAGNGGRDLFLCGPVGARARRGSRARR